ncbi:MAG: hypothetical protein FI707_12085 [SAR202 cluster bacterium]|jgi:hypothetical protein|nr:hypothetical protein [Chloroflexota bacterium]MDP6422641.1 hypothetical protein [SAR202 cluster bacterium]HAL48479.1 hypothetical protein [Dehalococcoidia bacterium]MDP6663075.1 hypothetical protein [SAR202 cluster bacterium]MDP6798765.1 hypothetical protein [SAR202 cluster bacterium]|tara:strand:+ start:1517 stop:1765 length:249 start_codon:yes stop_codon:yes gene_type:complete
MDSSLMRKIEKAKDYALQPERIRFRSYKAEFRGDNGNHAIAYESGKWGCDCEYYERRGTCTHIMAMQFMLEGMLAAGATALP